MDLAQPIYPMRSVIQCKAKMQLTADESELTTPPLDETLLQEVAMTLFQSDRYRDRYHACRSQEEAAAIEDTLATELAATYKQIKLQQQNPMIRQLNGLL
jgi:hypothetical protein